MPSLPMYLEKNDLPLVQGWLNEDLEIAYLVSDGPKRWRASKTVEKLTDGVYTLWHIPTGPLILLPPKDEKFNGVISDPWKGWNELRTGADPTKPYFGPGYVGVLDLDIRTNSKVEPEKIGISSFGWIGNYFSVLGNKADPATKLWWEKLKKWAKKNATKIPRIGPVDGPKAEIWAFPHALKAIQTGKPRRDNPF